MPAFALVIAPARLTTNLHSCYNAPLPIVCPKAHHPAASVLRLAPLHCRREITRPVSCYALFQGWLLLSQPPGCLGDLTSFDTKPGIRGLSWRSGLFPSRRWSLAPTVSLPGTTVAAFVVWLGSLSSRPLAHPVPYLRNASPRAAPKCISGRTSYLRVRLAFHPYPQLIPQF